MCQYDPSLWTGIISAIFSLVDLFKTAIFADFFEYEPSLCESHPVANFVIMDKLADRSEMKMCLFPKDMHLVTPAGWEYLRCLDLVP